MTVVRIVIVTKKQWALLGFTVPSEAHYKQIKINHYFTMNEQIEAAEQAALNCIRLTKLLSEKGYKIKPAKLSVALQP